MIKLKHVKQGELINHTFLVSVIVEAKARNCPLFNFTSTNGDFQAFNQIMDWLVATYPAEFQMEAQ